jgi:arylformamidase
MRLIDISIDIYSGLPQVAPYENTLLVPVLTPNMEGSNGRTTREFRGIVHSGTHIDGPEHLTEGRKQIHEFPLETFYGDAVVADLRHVPAGEAITAEHLDEAVGDKVKPNDMLLIRTGRSGWSKRIETEGYAGASPYLAKEASEWCIEKNIKLLGADCRPNKPGDPNFTAEKTLLEHGILYLKNLDNLDAIQQDRVTLIAFPLKLVGTEAAMTRAVVVED